MKFLHYHLTYKENSFTSLNPNLQKHINFYPLFRCSSRFAKITIYMRQRQLHHHWKRKTNRKSETATFGFSSFEIKGSK